MELCTGGELFDRIIEAGHFSEAQGACVVQQMFRALFYMHECHVCHRDLKPENFLVLRGGDVQRTQLKLIDFGTAKRFDLNSLVTKVCTPHYVAPELLQKGKVPYSEKVDVWACGVILYQVLSGHLPFQADKDIDLLRLVKKGRFEFRPARLWSMVSDSARELINAMLALDVKSRCTADFAFHHPWVHDQYVQDDVALSKRLMKQMHLFLTVNRLKRVALRIIARQINDESIDRLRAIFLSMDEDNSGTIMREEMEEAVKQIGSGDMAQAGMVEIMCQLDPTGSGAVEYTEFLAATLGSARLPESACKAAFRSLDPDLDGQIRVGELQEAIKSPGYTSDGQELHHLISRADSNCDGAICYDEFVAILNAKDGRQNGFIGGPKLADADGLLGGA
uniref:Calmodulin n=1 Tax=Zooxanthella nutricula TaxID=1333877 RepID=A0A7S2K290_9DINO